MLLDYRAEWSALILGHISQKVTQSQGQSHQGVSFRAFAPVPRTGPLPITVPKPDNCQTCAELMTLQTVFPTHW